VRIHRDESVAGMGAQAYTKGQHIHLAPGKGDLSTKEGRSLLAHELAHVVQQRQGRASSDGARRPDGRALEFEADEVGHAAVSGKKANVSGFGAGAQAKEEGSQNKGEGAQLKEESQNKPDEAQLNEEAP